MQTQMDEENKWFICGTLHLLVKQIFGKTNFFGINLIVCTNMFQVKLENFHSMKTM